MTYQKPPTPEDALEHFGVRGMKWGIRRGASKSGGVGRIRAGAAQGLLDEARRRRSASSSVAKNLGYNLLNGRIRTRKGNLKVAKREEASAARILAGKTTAKDFLRAHHNMTLADLLIKTTPVTQNNRPKK